MKKVAVMGLVDWVNYGEQFLANTVSYLVGSEYNVKSIDFKPRKNIFGYFIYGITVVLAKILSFWKDSNSVILFGVKCFAKRYYKRQLKDCQAVIFACGSYKFGTQKLWAYYSVVIQVAEEYHIPVMFNAMNIQDYDETDCRCRCLKQHTNFPCVKFFTTRDGDYGLDKLRRCYLEKDSNIFSDTVGDPAFWIPECYNVQKKDKSNKIGVNLIRSGVFADYGLHITEDELINIYCQLVKRLEKENVDWEFFTNGLEVDFAVGKTILERCGISGRNIVVPQNAKHLVEIIAGYKAIIGARLHACICAYSLDVPLVSFIWDEKMLRFAQIAELEDNFLTEEELTGDALYDRLNVMIQKPYNKELRNMWKVKTKETIHDFLTTYFIKEN